MLYFISKSHFNMCTLVYRYSVIWLLKLTSSWQVASQHRWTISFPSLNKNILSSSSFTIYQDHWSRSTRNHSKICIFQDSFSITIPICIHVPQSPFALILIKKIIIIMEGFIYKLPPRMFSSRKHRSYIDIKIHKEEHGVSDLYCQRVPSFAHVI